MKKSEKHIAIFDCYSGVSGDMAVGAFLDCGMDFAHLKRELQKLKLNGYVISKQKVKKKGIQGTKFTVTITQKRGHKKKAITFREIKSLLDRSSLDKNSIALSKQIFTELAKAEGAVHGQKCDDVHFHEVGAVDSIIDIVSVAICFTFFNIKKAYVKNIHIGSGSVRTSSHGTFPLPAPATIKLLEGYPLTFTNIPHELITPTGASCIATLTQPNDAIPPLVVDRIGYGAGTNEFNERSNFFRLMIGRLQHALHEEELSLVETNIDDMQPFVYEELFEKLFARGARDVFVTPILMKKNRPAHMLSVLCEQTREEIMLNILFSETSTIGVRVQTVRRATLSREIVSVKTKFGSVQVKVSKNTPSKGDSSIRKAYPEYESCKRIAQRKKVPLLAVYSEAQYCAQKNGW